MRSTRSCGVVKADIRLARELIQGLGIASGDNGSRLGISLGRSEDGLEESSRRALTKRA